MPTRPLVIDFDRRTARRHDRRQRRGDPDRSGERSPRHPGAHLLTGENTVQVRFRAGEAPLNRSADLLYTLFVPARARQALPCFDQPDLKGRWTVTLEHPSAWQSVANGAERERIAIGNRVRVGFAETQPLPTYLVAFVAGRMSVETGEHLGRTMRALPPRERSREAGAQSRGAVRAARPRRSTHSSATPASRIRSASSTSC